MQKRISSIFSTTFGDMPETAVLEMMQLMRLRTCRKGTHLFRQGEEPHSIYFVESGLVKWHKLTPDGHEQTLQLAGPGEAIGLVALLDRGNYIASAMVVEESRVWEMPMSGFDRLISAHPEVALAILRRLGSAVRWLVENVHCVSSRSALERVATVLVQKATSTDTGCEIIALTHQEIAHLGGMARETASRVLAELQRRGAVRLTRNAVVLVDSDLLWEQQSRRARSG